MTTQRLDHHSSGQAAVYEIRIQGHLSAHRAEWFEGREVQSLENGETVLRGTLADQPALFGMLSRIRDAGIPLLEVRRVA